MRGKVLLMLVNEPPSDDANFFKGKALTYYGRWTYKYEEAARKGAVGVILIHKTEMASYPLGSGAQFQFRGEILSEGGRRAQVEGGVLGAAGTSPNSWPQRRLGLRQDDAGCALARFSSRPAARDVSKPTW